MRMIATIAALLLTGCGLFGGQEQPDWLEVRNKANAARVKLNSVAEDIAENAPLIMAVCALRGDDSTECKALYALWDIARVSLQAAHAAVDVLDATGVEMIAIDAATDRVAKSAKQLGDAVKRVGEVLHEVVASSDRSGSDSGGTPAQPAPGKEAPAEGGGSTVGHGGAGSGAKEAGAVGDAGVGSVPARDDPAPAVGAEQAGPAGGAGPGAPGEGRVGKGEAAS